jgi:hypothetical protein
MNKPNTKPALYVASLFLAVTALSAPLARAELVSQNVREDAITPEANDDEVVIVKKRPAPQQAPLANVQVNNNANNAAPAQPAPAKPSMGAALDQSMNNKMDDVRNQFENAVIKTMDRIKVTVDDGATPTPPAQQPAAPATTVVQDNLAGKSAAPAGNNPAYLSVDAAPEVAGEADKDGETVAAADEAKPASGKKSVILSPLFGKSSINDNLYNVNNRYSAGIELEVPLDDSFSAVLGYAYSQYDVGLASANPFMGYYSGTSLLNNNLAQLQYNQNLITAEGRFYLMPRESKFRIFGGLGIGYNLGYLNYNNSVLNQYAFNPALNNPDYTVDSWTGILEAGAAVNVSQSVALGLNFKYNVILSSSQNQPLNNYAFVNNGFGYTPTSNQAVVGGSLARDSFYSILGTVKVAF